MQKKNGLCHSFSPVLSDLSSSFHIQDGCTQMLTTGFSFSWFFELNKGIRNCNLFRLYGDKNCRMIRMPIIRLLNNVTSPQLSKSLTRTGAADISIQCLMFSNNWICWLFEGAGLIFLTKEVAYGSKDSDFWQVDVTVYQCSS